MLITILPVNAQESDNNIVITEKNERYEFVKGDKDAPVQVKQEFYTRYRCNSVRGNVSYVQFYDDQSRIDDVSVLVSGKRQRSIQPKYEYYSVNNIFYSDARVCYFGVPLEKKGAESEVVLEKTVLDPKYFTGVYFPEAVPVETKKVEIVIPVWMKASLREMNFDGYNVTKTIQRDSRKNADIYTYIIKALGERKDLPGMPGPSHVYPHLLILTQQASLDQGTIKYFESVDELYKWYHSLTAGLSAGSANIKATSDKITAGAAHPVDKMKKVLHWVQDNIRYIAFENGLAGFKPAEADDVLARKYGDCKGMANLTKALLRAAGLDARLCWIGTNHIAYDYSTPSLAVDNHMICAVLSDQKKYFLDGTESYIGFDEYAQRIQGRQVLIEDGNSYILDRVPLRTPDQNAKRESAVINVDGTTLKGTVKVNWKGESKSSLLAFIHSSGKQDQTPALTNYFSDGRNNYKISDVTIPSFHDWSGDLHAEYKFEWKDAVSNFGTELYIEPDFRKEFGAAIIDTSGRTMDYEFPYKYNVIQQTTFVIPSGYSIKALPEALSIEREGYTIKASVSRNKDGLYYEKNIVIKNPLVKMTSINQWNADIKALQKQYNEQIILTRQ